MELSRLWRVAATGLPLIILGESVTGKGEFHVDILARLSEMFRYEEIEAEERLVEGVRVRLATPRMLYRMKKDTVRLQDRAAAERLRKRFGLEE